MEDRLGKMLPLSPKQEGRTQVISQNVPAEWLQEYFHKCPSLPRKKCSTHSTGCIMSQCSLGIDATLRKDNTKYHQSCLLMWNNRNLQRAQERAATEITSQNMQVKRKCQKEAQFQLNVSYATNEVKNKTCHDKTT